MLSIEPKIEEDQMKSYRRNYSKDQNYFDSRNYIMEDHNEFWKEKEFVGVQEDISTGHQAISLDFSIGNNE